MTLPSTMLFYKLMCSMDIEVETMWIWTRWWLINKIEPRQRTLTSALRGPKEELVGDIVEVSRTGGQAGKQVLSVKQRHQQWKIRTHVIWSLRSDLMPTARPSSRTCCCTPRCALRHCLAGRGRRRGRLSSWKAADCIPVYLQQICSKTF